MKPEVREAQLNLQHDRAASDWMRLVNDPQTTVEILHCPAGQNPQPHADVWALSVIEPRSDQGFWLGHAESDAAARSLADDIGVVVAQ